MRHTRTMFLAVAALLAVSASAALAQGDQQGAMHEAHATHIALTPGDIQWKAAPPVLPAGAEIAVLEGDPTKEGPFTLRLKLPEGYAIQPHTHPVIEHVTVISGAFGIGLGETFDESVVTWSEEGGFYVMSPGTAHFAVTRDETVIQLHSSGPWALNYVNPADDPRNQTSSPGAAEATTVKSSKSNSSE